MRGADTLIPARFLSLLGHFCVLVTLLWESNRSVRHCLPSRYHDSHFQIYHSRLVGGLITSVVLIVVEFTTFIFGLTMFSSSVALTSIAGHGFASVLLTYFVLDGWLCDWFWPIFFFCSLVPSVVDLATAVANEHQHLTQSHDYKAGWSFYLVLAGVITTLGSSLPVGFNIGVVNTPADLIKSFCNESFITRYDVELSKTWLNVLWSSVVSIFIIGGCTGSILGSVLADKLGRKKATILTNVLSLAGAVLFLFCRIANSVEMLIIGRLLVGLSGGLTTSIVPMYLTELSPSGLTGAMGVACPMGVNVGVLVGQVMGLKFLLGGVDDWPYLLSVYALLVIVSLPVLFVLPESPKYLFVVKRNELDAINELSRLRGVSPSILTEDLELLREETRNEASSSGENWSMVKLLQEPRLRLPLLLTCSMQAGQQTSGINAVFYYSQTIFEQAGLSELQAQYATIGSGFINVCTAVFMLYLLPRCGRRPLLLASIFIASVLLAALAATMKFIVMCIRLWWYAGYFGATLSILAVRRILSRPVPPMYAKYIGGTETTLENAASWMPYVCMVAVLAYVLVYGFGLGPIPYFIASEMFEVGPRPAGMAWGSLANWGGNFLVGMCFPTMRDVIGPYSFLVFATITMGLFVFQKFYFPETRGKTPSQVTQLCSRGFKSRPLRSSNLHHM